MLISLECLSPLHRQDGQDTLLYPSCPMYACMLPLALQGGVATFEEPEQGGRSGYVGWMGFGGSVFQWHPELKIGQRLGSITLDFGDILESINSRNWNL